MPRSAFLLAFLAACATTGGDLKGFTHFEGSPEAAADGGVPGEAGSGPLRPVLTVPEAVAEALAHNRTVQQARLNVAIGLDNEKEARAAMLPAIGLTGSYSLVDERGRVNAPGASFPTEPKDVWGLAVAMDFPIFAFGRHINTWRAAQLARHGAESTQRTAEADTAAAVTAAALDVLETIDAVEVARSNEEALAQQMRDAQAQLDAGSVTKVAVLEASVEHDRARRDREKLQSLVPIRKMTLNKLLGRPADGPVDIVHDPDTRAPIWQLGALVEEALDRRPELRTARLAVAGAERTLEATVGAEMGEIRGSVIWDADDNPFRSPDNQTNLLLTLDVPVFTGGARSARIRRARHQLESAGIIVRDLEADVRVQVAEAYRAAIEAYRDIGVAKSAVERQEESVRIQREKFTNGRATSREVLDSVALLRNARFSLLNATYSYDIALRELLRARGADPRLDPFYELEQGGMPAPPAAPTGPPRTQGEALEEAIRRSVPE
jgi:outer membrane protein TolC